MSKKCPICESKQLIQVKNNYKSSGSLEIFRCDTCDFEFLNSWDDVNHVKSLYEDDKYIFIWKKLSGILPMEVKHLSVPCL